MKIDWSQIVERKPEVISVDFWDYLKTGPVFSTIILEEKSYGDNKYSYFQATLNKYYLFGTFNSHYALFATGATKEEAIRKLVKRCSREEIIIKNPKKTAWWQIWEKDYVKIGRFPNFLPID